MIKQVSKIEHKIGEKVFEFHCDFNSSLGEAHDALCHFKDFVFERMKEHDEQQNKIKTDEIKNDNIQ